MTDTREILLSADTMDAYIALFGLNDRNISIIEQECSVHIALRGNQLLIQGNEEQLNLAEETIRILFGICINLSSTFLFILLFGICMNLSWIFLANFLFGISFNSS